MEIFTFPPKDWVDLQNKVAYILRFSGFDVETPKKISTVRGDVEFDVFARNKDITVACECKYWKNRVPQSVVYAFRSQLSDAGVNKGYVVTMVGFQSGSYESADNTIVELKTWNDFLHEYREMYLREQISALLKIKRPIFRVVHDKAEYWAAYEGLGPENKRIADELKERLLRLFLLFVHLCDAIQYEYTSEIGWNLDYIDRVILHICQNYEVVFSCYFDFFKWLNDQITTIVGQIERIYEMKIL